MTPSDGYGIRRIYSVHDNDQEDRRWTITYCQAVCGQGHGLSGRYSCADCDAGYYQPDSNTRSSCLACVAGSYQSDTGQSSCDAAPKGNYVASDAATAYTPCPTYHYQESEGQTTCHGSCAWSEVAAWPTDINGCSMSWAGVATVTCDNGFSGADCSTLTASGTMASLTFKYYDPSSTLPAQIDVDLGQSESGGTR